MDRTVADGGVMRAPDEPVRPARKSLRRRLRRRLKLVGRSNAATRVLGSSLYTVLRLTYRSQTLVRGSSPFREILTQEHPAIVGLWHGQHLLAPFFRPAELPYVALLSRSRDAELNASVVERFGIDTVRGSGGRVREATSKKGGVTALLALLRSLREGKGVCMIADVPNGVARQSGLGIVTLARLSGRPIIPSAAVTSRRRVIENTWDRITLPLPFGRVAVVMGDPIFVPRDLDEAGLEAKRREVTEAIEAANRRALALVDGSAIEGPRS
ncbi:lysophospholipid acyltransferase family protein [Aureimonas mangrovi]|uniref:lysophospholipid acyltransferase family protein n=1 Tax=Aureimonas mangrovi TaxID=2758041 RepID=UPI00163D7864|nr:lysophospholipid acyltransferase family protein [Aureimonas mangrovi]